jgi:hypothetical protein
MHAAQTLYFAWLCIPLSSEQALLIQINRILACTPAGPRVKIFVPCAVAIFINAEHTF